ncbi:guanosine-3',5'-bis(diphosphate) 3'-pyrophosphohydrolase MESH1-like [Tubulanus polymorphus]|uniref:guanosine-3',5'-bis(diphosphate) 3'-pyrophosphohydrolase MESH1-like n=1 Tax=Tubulanus polymorphus TaxID=672921 RepID=UPI003DA608DE
MTEVKTLMKCVDFAAKKHKFQKRKDPERTPYINHPIGVANILTEEAKIDDIVIIQAALLHDTVEDTETTFEELEATFGKEVTDIVREVTDDKSLPSVQRKQLQIEHAVNASRAAKLVKLADKLYNLRDLNRVSPRGWTPQRIHDYFVWASKVVNGCRGTNSYLETSLDQLFKQRQIIL